MPIIIWMVKSESAVITGIAKQALLLNVIVCVVFLATVVLWITVILTLDELFSQPRCAGARLLERRLSW